MSEKNNYDELRRHFDERKDSYNGVYIAFYSIKGFIPWLWCLPLPRCIIGEVSSPPAFKIENAYCDIQVEWGVITNKEFETFLIGLTKPSRNISING